MFQKACPYYDIGPPSSHTEQGTLTCPGTKLDIRTGQFSWPYSYNGYSVQTVPAVNGPWSTSDATPVLQDGKNTIITPVDSDNQFFRLCRP